MGRAIKSVFFACQNNGKKKNGGGICALNEKKEMKTLAYSILRHTHGYFVEKTNKM